MRKIISLVLTFTLLSQTLVVPLSVSAKAPSTNLNTQASTVSYTYDSSGNLTSDGERSITWDASGMPAKIELRSKNLEASFVYDGNSQRIAKIVKNNTGQVISSTIYFGNIEKEIVVDGATTVTKHYFSGGKRIALRKNNDPPVFLHKDHLSSSTLFTDSSGGKKDALLTYFPYGNERPNWDYLPSTFNPPPSNHLYTDQIKDPETDLYYYNARYYSPQTGLFISADTANKDLNKYAYGNNNPLIYTDPSGNFPFLLLPLIAVAAWMLVTPMSSGYSSWQYPNPPMEPVQAEFSVTFAKMASPGLSLALSGAELYRGKRLGSDREMSTFDTATNVLDVAFSGGFYASQAVGTVNKAIQTAKVKSLPHGEALLNAKSLDEINQAMKGTGYIAEAKEMKKFGHMQSYPPRLFVNSKSNLADQLLAGKHEGIHALTFSKYLDRVWNKTGKLSKLFDRIANENLAHAPVLGNSPFHVQMANSITSATGIEQIGYALTYGPDIIDTANHLGQMVFSCSVLECYNNLNLYNENTDEAETNR